MSEVGGNNVPPPPQQRADRFGVYNWNIEDSAFPGGPLDRLNWGAKMVAQVGSRTIRVYLGARDIYRVNPPGAPDLAQIAASSAYDQLFRDPRFRTYLLTVYSSRDSANGWADGFTTAEYQAEREEVKRLGDYLLSNYAGKTFILFNWEGDNAIGGNDRLEAVWDSFRDWIQSRADGVKLARQSNPGSSAHLYSGLEFNLIRKLVGNKEMACGGPGADPLQSRCVIDYVAPRVDVDYYSYSSWQSISVKWKNPHANLKEVLEADLGFALAKVKASRPEITEINFIIGEYGFLRSHFGECNAANLIGEMFDALEGPDAFQVSYAVYWQIMDNEDSFSPEPGSYGLFRAHDGQLEKTLLAVTFQQRLAGQSGINYTGCPSLSRGELSPGNILFLRGSSFSSEGNTVVVIRPDGGDGLCYFLLPRENIVDESPEQIRAFLPMAVPPSRTLFYVIDKQGRESNARELNLISNTMTSTSAASYRGSVMAQESIVAAFGQALATTTLSSQSMPLPSNLGGTQVLIRDRNGFEQFTPLFFVSPTQVNYQIPPGMAIGPATVVVMSGDGTVSTGAVEIVGVSPGLFTANSDGQGVAAAIALRVRADGSRRFEPVAIFDESRNNFISRPIGLSDETEQVFLILFGTGIRFRSSLSEVTAEVGGAKAAVLYAGPSPEFIGLDQVNLQLPHSLTGRGEADVILTVNGQTANTVKVSIR